MELLQRIVRAILLIIVAGAVCWLLWWLIGYLGVPEPFSKIGSGIIAVGAVFVLIAILFDLVGYPIIKLPPQS